jgi:hypothetical protein
MLPLCSTAFLLANDFMVSTLIFSIVPFGGPVPSPFNYAKTSDHFRVALVGLEEVLCVLNPVNAVPFVYESFGTELLASCHT